MPRDDEKGVVDADCEPDHHGEQRCRARDRDERGGTRNSRHDDADTDEGADQRHPGGEERPECDHEHQAREDHAEHFGDGEIRRIVLKDGSAELDPEARVFSDRPGGGQVIEHLGRDGCRGSVELHLNARHSSVVTDRGAGELVEGSENRVDSLEVGDRRDGVVDRGAEVCIRDVSALGCDEDHLSARAGDGGEHGGEPVECGLRFGSRDLV